METTLPVCPRCHSANFIREPFKKICLKCGNEFYLSNASTMITDDFTGEVTYRDITSKPVTSRMFKKESVRKPK